MITINFWPTAWLPTLERQDDTSIELAVSGRTRGRPHSSSSFVEAERRFLKGLIRLNRFVLYDST
jgi:hypothetical protein